MDNNHPADNQLATASNSHLDNSNRAVRTSARVRASKNKPKPKEQQQESSPSASSVARLTRSAKGKAKADPELQPLRTKSKRSDPILTINEPPKDPKGKKRAIPEPSSEDEASASPKRPRTSSYSLRSLGALPDPNAVMPRKPRVSNSKAKAVPKSKMNAPGSSRLQDDEDVDMVDVPVPQDGDDDDTHQEVVDDCLDNAEDDDKDGCGDTLKPDSEGMEDDDDDDEVDDGNMMGDGDGMPGGMDEATALAMFGDYRQFGSFMMSIGSRLKTMLTNIKKTADPTTRLLALQELSELLSISTEDTLAGSFQVEQFVSELVKILGGRGTDEEDDEGNEDEEHKDEDAALAAALALSTGASPFQGDENPEAQVLACRCLANLMEALPGVAHTVVYHGAIPVLCSKLIEISYIDLAEQTLSTMEKISEEFPSAIVREGGLAALLNYLDFFSIAVQRTALQAAANCCRNISSDHFSMIQGAWPIIRNCLSYSDQRLVEFACLCIIRVIDSYHRSSTEYLETLIDTDTIRAINGLLLPAGGTSMIASNTFTLLLRALATAARASASVTINLLTAGIVDTLYQILTGVLPSADVQHTEPDAFLVQGLGGGITDMAVMETLAHRSKDQVDEALSLISELMPPLPKDGVFDHRSYTEKALSRLVKAKAKADRASAKQAAQAQLHAALLLGPPPSTRGSDSTTPPPASEETENSNSPAVVPNDRAQLLRSNMPTVGRFMRLIVPILIDVYSASVSIPLRIKTLNGILKATSFLDGEELGAMLLSVPVATFTSSILSTKDHPSLVIGALQLVEILLTKNAALFKPSFRREGVFYEIETGADRMLSSKKDKDSAPDSASQDSSAFPPAPPAPLPSSLKKLSSLSLEPDDAITLRARIVRFKQFSDMEKAEENNAFEQFRKLVGRLSKADATEKDAVSTLRQLANHFSSTTSSVSSFEVLQSGVVGAILDFIVDSQRKLSIAKRRELFLNTFSPKNTQSSMSPMSMFVKKLQESLTRIESFDVVTVTQGYDDSKRSSPSLLARQLRLRLVTDEDTDIPKGLQNIVVSIHAIATFQALHDYLRPRVAGIVGTSGTRLSGMLAALAASYGGIPRGDGSSASAPVPSMLLEDHSNSASISAPLRRRRSQRLNAKNGTDGQQDEVDDGSSVLEADDAPEKCLEDSDAVLDRAETIEPEVQPDMSDDEVDAEVFEGDEDGDTSMSDKTVTLSVAEDGSKVEAQTPDGTRVATPSLSTSEPSASVPGVIHSRQSYAAALKTNPTDWHIEFFMEDQELPLDLTIYGAIHQHEMRKQNGAFPPSLIWQGLYTVKFKKVPGPPRDARVDSELPTKSRIPTPSLACLPEDAPEAKILRLLRVLYLLNANSTTPDESPRLPASAFINNKLSAKLTRQLEEPMIVASSCLPEWAQELPQHFPFLFPFSTRYSFLQSTSFGYARLIMKWQSQNARSQENSRRDDGIGFLGRLQRQKVRVSRKHILESAVKVFELYGSSSSILEVEYFEEVGTGLGPTLEFYSLVSREFARKDLKIWRDGDVNDSSRYVSHRQGLYPAPISPADVATDGGQKRTHLLRVVGQFVAKAMLDSRIIDLHFNKIFLQLVLEDDVPATIATLQLVDSELANSLAKLENIISDSSSPSSDKYLRKLGLAENKVKIEDLALDFTIPGYDIELRPGGRDIMVTSENAKEYIHEVLDALVGSGAQCQAKAFRDGFSKVFNVSDLQSFSADELIMLFGNSDEDWSIETLNDALKADHGFNMESRAIRHLLDVMTKYDAVGRRNFLQFITGSPKLPIGGFRGLNPPLTIVRKPHEAPLRADDYLPSVMTCVNYLKVPEYTSQEILQERLKTAIHEGKSAFHLS